MYNHTIKNRGKLWCVDMQWHRHWPIGLARAILSGIQILADAVIPQQVDQLALHVKFSGNDLDCGFLEAVIQQAKTGDS